MKILLMTLLVLASCTKGENSAKGALQSLANAFEEKNVSKEFLLSKTTGKLNQEIQDSNDSEWENYFGTGIAGPYKIYFEQETCNKIQCVVTYIVKYKQASEDKENSQIEVKKVATVVLVDGNWLVAEITNIKTHIENKNDLKIESTK